MLNFGSNGPSGAELFAIFYISIFSYLVKRAWSNPWLNRPEMKPKLIRVVQNYDAVILVTKLSLYDLSVRSQYFSVQRFQVSRVYAPGA